MRASFLKSRVLSWLAVSALLLAVNLSGFPAGAQTGASGNKHVKKPPRPRGVRDAAAQPAPGSPPGKYYALVIGNNNYPRVHSLQTPISDATAVAQLLHDRYGFRTELLRDANRAQILTALVRYRSTLTPNSNLLIYYAGHGILDRAAGEAYWVPVDGDRENNMNWISADDITRAVRAIPAKHVLVISDSCYSGAILTDDSGTRDLGRGITLRDHMAYLARLDNSKSRNWMASGSKEPVADDGAPGHSIFAAAILQGLAQMKEDEFAASDLFYAFVKRKVAGNAPQLPQYGSIRDSGDDLGDFIFSRVHDVLAPIQPAIVDEIVPVKEVHAILPPPPPADPDADSVLAALHRYEDAYESMDINMLKTVWPSLTKEQIDKLKAGFRGAQAVKVQLLQCDKAATDGDAAQVRCAQSMEYTRDGRRQPAETRPVEISLRKGSDGGWVVADVRAR